MKSKELFEVSFTMSLLFTPDPEGGFVVTCEELPEFLTDGDTIEQAMENVEDAFLGVLEIYLHTNRKLPKEIIDSAFIVNEPRFITKTPSNDDYPNFCFQASIPPPRLERQLRYSEVF